MGRENFLSAGDPGAIDALYARFLNDPHSVPRDLAAGFARFLEENGGADTAAAAWRTWGYRIAALSPLGLHEERTILALPEHPLSSVYGGSVGWQIMHVPEAERRTWLTERAERQEFQPSSSDRAWMLETLTRAEALGQALQRRFPNVKRFGHEGAESFLVLCEIVLRVSAAEGVRRVIVGGMHRGRLDLLVHVLNKPLTELVSEIRDFSPARLDTDFSGDVAYHNGYASVKRVNGVPVELSTLPHPSHLSMIAPIALGRTRASQLAQQTESVRRVLPIVLHTDAAFAGQGVIAETLQLSRLPAYQVGGAIHLVLDNHLGFTTEPWEGRSTRYSTDFATAVGIPVLHVNGDDPDAVFRVASIAAHYRAKFAADIVVCLHGYRRHGHNELDEPRFTQPMTYRAVDARPSISDLYAKTLAAAGVSIRPSKMIRTAVDDEVGAASKLAGPAHVYDPTPFGGNWAGLRAGSEAEMTAFVETGLPKEQLKRLGRATTRIPPDFELHPKTARFFEQRLTSIETDGGINWATAEALAFSSLAAEGYSVRLSGQDTPRGAFSQRHLFVHDQAKGRQHLMLDGAGGGCGRIEAFNTPMSEFATLAFEYGYSLGAPKTLVCWEAQFGDFLNLAQALVDQFIAATEARWRLSSGIVLLLPHGLDGGGPDHSTAHPERLLASCAGGNVEVAYPSTPAQYFHLLRRQMLREYRKPLFVLTPKTLLRHPSCVSGLADLETGTGYRHVLEESGEAAERVILCSGKIAFELDAERRARGLADRVTLVRIEHLYPLDLAAIGRALARHPHAELTWCQEEHENMGAFRALRHQVESVAGRPLRYAGRPAAASPATGFANWHDEERALVIEAALGGIGERNMRENVGSRTA